MLLLLMIANSEFVLFVAIAAQGINELKESLHVESLSPEIQHFLDRFNLSRIGIRFLIGQHIGLSNPSEDPHVVGIIDTNTNIADVGQSHHFISFKDPTIFDRLYSCSSRGHRECSLDLQGLL